MERKQFTICEKCAGYSQPSDFLYESSAALVMCADCCTYNPSGECVQREYPVEFVEAKDKGGDNLRKYQVFHKFIDSMTDEEYDEALAEEFAAVTKKEEIPFREWQKKHQK